MFLDFAGACLSYRLSCQGTEYSVLKNLLVTVYCASYNQPVLLNPSAFA